MASLSYAATDAFMVRLAFLRGRRETSVYHFPRRLLGKGLHVAAETGDVLIGPHEEVDAYLVVTLTPRGAYPFALYVERLVVERFLLRCYALVPGGQEDAHLDAGVDAAIAAIFGRQVTS
jgi:hypothetical protein